MTEAMQRRRQFAISGEDHIPVKARVLVMLALTKTIDRAESRDRAGYNKLGIRKALEFMDTERLELIPATIELCEAETRGRAALEACFGARVPTTWPPPVFEPDDVARIRAQLEADPTIGSWTLHYILARPGATAEGRSLVGIAGYTGPPTPEGRVEIGYAIASEHQRRGYATEAVDALVRAAFRDPRVVVVSATTYPTLEPSIGVLTKNGFVRAGSEAADGTIRYVRRRDL